MWDVRCNLQCDGIRFVDLRFVQVETQILLYI